MGFGLSGIVLQELTMTTFSQFCDRAKMRHDFSDQIQVRYPHPDGEDYDTWVSGEEVLQRLRSEAAEKRLKGVSRLEWQEIRQAGRDLPEQAKKKVRDRLKDQLADTVEGIIGGNVIGDSLADNIRGRDANVEPRQWEKQKWQASLQDEAFRTKVLELAWLNLAGSFPATPTIEPDDWT
jgi:hypothetical protein